MDTKPDSLTRRSGDLPSKGGDYERLSHRSQVVIKPHNLLEVHATDNLLVNVEDSDSSELTELEEEEIDLLLSEYEEDELALPPSEKLFDAAYEDDLFPATVLKMLADDVRHSKEVSLAECTIDNGRLRFRGKLWVSDYQDLCLQILRDNHDSTLAGHQGRAKTLELVQRHYYWPSIYKYIERYVQNCHVCSRSKPSRHAKQGFLCPLPVPDHRWKDLSMDFVVGLPDSEGYDAIWNVACRLTKMRHLIPCHSTIGAHGLAKLFVKHFFRLHGLPEFITSDRETQFVNRFWKRLCVCLGIASKLSTSYHPKTDGQTERLNAIMKQYLRMYIS